MKTDLPASTDISLTTHIHDVARCKRQLSQLDKQWIRITLTGKINSTNVASTLIEFMEGTQQKFLSLQDNLLHSLASKNIDKIVQEMAGLAQVSIDILKRNLFERTADVGFLATDDALVEFLRSPENQADMVGLIEERLLAYRDKYTVYEEIVIFDKNGNVRAHLDKNSSIRRSTDPLLEETLENDGYLETFRPSDIRPGKDEVLLYSHRIIAPDTHEPLGVLCLGFDFAGEMQGVYKNLLQKDGPIICILDDKGIVISSSDFRRVPVGVSLGMVLRDDFRLVSERGDTYLAKTARTNGYQGFVGLPWFGHVLYPVGAAFRLTSETYGDARAGGDAEAVRSTKLFSGALKEIDDAADDILSDLGLVVLNGEVMAAKQTTSDDPIIRQEANALPPVLGAIHQVGESIRGIFAESISSLLHTVMSSKINDTKFLASLAIDIMDRNLYERANDCRWWALNATFRQLLAKRGLDTNDQKYLHGILSYINALYTVYTNLILYDLTGRVVAISDPKQPDLINKRLQYEYIQSCLRLNSSQAYCVSPFERSPLYASQTGTARHTYIYNAPVFHPESSETVIGGIAIVFDSEPQFQAMLEDALPRDEDGSVQEGSIGFFIDRNQHILSATSPDWRVGDVLPLPHHLVALDNGEQRSEIISLGSERYIAGCAMSNGYREYKRDGVYDNDVLAVILAEI